MDEREIRIRLVDGYDAMPEQLRLAARYILDRPREVALLSMREQSRQAGVQPATMTRLAQRIGLEGYDSMRRIHADSLRDADSGFFHKAGAQVARQKQSGDRSLAAEMLGRTAAQVTMLAEPEGLDRLEHAARLLAGAGQVFCLGLRSSFAVAWQFHYILTMVGKRAVLLDTPGGTALDRLGGVKQGDVVLAVSVAPYTKDAVHAAQFAHQQGATLVTITDSKVSPLARIAREVIFVPTESASFLHSMASAFACAEILGALVAGQDGEGALAALARFDRQAQALGVHLEPETTVKGLQA